MKKFLLTAALMLTTAVGAWAQDIDANVYYRIKNVGRSGYLSTNGNNMRNEADNAADTKQYWKFEAGEGDNAGKYALKNVEGRYMNYQTATETTWQLSNTPVYYTLGNVAGTEKYTIAFNPSKTYGFAHAAQNGRIVTWGSGSEASQWTIEKTDFTELVPVTVVYSYMYDSEKKFTREVQGIKGVAYPTRPDVGMPYGFVLGETPSGVIPANAGSTVNVDITISKVKELPFVVAADYASIKRWYYMYIRDANSYLKYESGVNYIKAATTKATIDAASDTDKDAYTWAFVGTDPFDGYKIVNKATGATYILSAPAAPTGYKNASELARMVEATVGSGNSSWIIKESGSADVFYVEHPTASSYAFNRQGFGTSSVQTLCYYDHRDVGCEIHVVERGVSAESKLRLALADAKAVATPAAETQGQVGYYSVAAVAAMTEAIATAQAVYDKVGVTDEEMTSAAAALQTVMNANREIVLPIAGKFYRIKNNAGNGYLVCGTSGQAKTGAGNGTNDIFYLTTDNQLVSYSNGLYFGTVTLNNSEKLAYKSEIGATSGIAFGFNASPEIGKLYISYKNGTRFIYSVNASGSIDAGNSTSASDLSNLTSAIGYRFTVEEVTSLPVNMSAGWATLYSPVQLACGAAVEAYTVDAVETGATSANLSSVGASIPAATGVILKAKEGVTGTVNLAVEEGTASATSALRGSYAAENVSADAYVLSNKNGIGLYLADKNQTGSTWKNNGFKAYLPAPAAGAPMLTFDFGTETGIEGIKGAVKANGAIYDLSGRRVKSATKGIFIINGKKVIK